ncbi:hypothetical protein [Streptomyces sp. NPDC006551]|uniref:hypothetical protein n=1 Tax=Streptomyces sp. NPDC006551 TaxID=3157178 RepID=UPI0033AFAF49
MASDTYACHTASSGARSSPSGSTVADTLSAHSVITDESVSGFGAVVAAPAG